MHTRRFFGSAAFAAASLLAAAGCDILDPGWSRKPGLVVDGTPPLTSLIAPDTVTRGVPFQITASSFGSSSCTRADGYQVTALSDEFEVRLFDQEAPPTVACTADFHAFPRVLTVQFDQAGMAELRVVGRGEGEEGQGPRIISKTIVVE
jgi:hypothetical protein